MSALSLRAYAKDRGCSLAAVQKAIKYGRITLTADGKVDKASADRDWYSKTNQAKQRVRRQATERPKAKRKAEPDVPPQGVTNSDVHAMASEPPAAEPDSFQKSRASREYYEAELAKLKLARELGNLIDRIKAQAAWGELVSTVRNRLMLIPDKVAPRAAAMGDNVLEIRALVDHEVREALSSLSEHEPDIE